jgi:Glycosyl transferases group 1
VRIAFLANPVYDHLQDMVFHGLASILGPENVVEYPPLGRYRSQAPPGAPHPSLWFDFPEPPRASLRETVLSADAVVIGSLRAGIRSLVDEVFELQPRTPVVYLDGEDDFYVLGIRSRVDVYCKREILLPGNRSVVREGVRRVHRRLRRRLENRDPLADPVSVARSRDRGLVPLTFGWPGPLPQRGPTDHDVAFLSNPTSHARALVRSDLERLAAEGIRVRMLAEGERLDWTSYMDVLARSRIGVSVRGGGFDTFRYWEIPAAGALLLAETPRIVIPGNFADGREAVFAPVDRIASRIRDLLTGDTEPIAREGRARLAAAHTSVHRAQTVLSALDALG